MRFIATLAQYINYGYIVLMGFFFLIIGRKTYKSFILRIAGVAALVHNRIKTISVDIRDERGNIYIEKRKAQRISIEKEITAKIINNEKSGSVKVLDISYKGARLRTHASFTPSETIDIEIYLPLFVYPITVTAKVARVRDVTEITNLLPSYDVGIEFLDLTRIDKDKLNETIRATLESEIEIPDTKKRLLMFESPGAEDDYTTLRKKFFNHTIRTLIKFMEYRIGHVIGHSDKVLKYCVMIAATMKLDKYFLLKVKIAGLFHDIGKIGIDKSILNKPGALNEDEWREIKKHSIISANIIKETGILKEIVDIVMYHHKYFDGTGYPDCDISGERIPLGARILAVADAYAAMTSSRPYRKKVMTKNEAIAELKRCAGGQFDPQIVKIFISLISK